LNHLLDYDYLLTGYIGEFISAVCIHAGINNNSCSGSIGSKLGVTSETADSCCQ